MKKCWLLILFFFPVKSYASLQDILVSQEKTYVVHYTTTVPSNTTGIFDLVSLSTTPSLFPHLSNSVIGPSGIPMDTGELDISAIHVVIDKVATATATIKIGVMNFVNTSTGSVSFFFTRSSLLNISNTDTVMYANYNPSFYRCKVRSGSTAANSFVDGLTPFLLTSEKDSGSGLYNSTGTVQSPISGGLVSMKTGDIIMKVQAFSPNAVNIIVDIWYHAEP